MAWSRLSLSLSLLIRLDSTVWITARRSQGDMTSQPSPNRPEVRGWTNHSIDLHSDCLRCAPLPSSERRHGTSPGYRQGTAMKWGSLSFTHYFLFFVFKRWCEMIWCLIFNSKLRWVMHLRWPSSNMKLTNRFSIGSSYLKYIKNMNELFVCYQFFHSHILLFKCVRGINEKTYIF